MKRFTQFLTAAMLGAALMAEGAAQASSPSATYVVPSVVDFFPDAATATSVRIEGAFFSYQTGGSYGAPACGYMYFSCPAGSEKMCRMQWTEIKNAIGQPSCQGFGPQSTVSKATLRSLGTPLGTPDLWDLGIGITPGQFVGGQCAPAQALKCSAPATSDMAGSLDMAGGGGNPPNPPVTPPGSSGCTLGGATGRTEGGSWIVLQGLTAVALAWGVIRQRRRRTR